MLECPVSQLLVWQKMVHYEGLYKLPSFPKPGNWSKKTSGVVIVLQIEPTIPVNC